MDHELICNWLGLSSATWPPDHYTLLGLQPGEADCARIEHQVHERLARIRCYQLSHPAVATEAMNRLAQAFLCLTDSQARKAYDAEFFPAVAAARAANPPPPPVRAPKPKTQRATQAVLTSPRPSPPPSSSAADTAVVPPKQTQVDWKDATPPPVRATPPVQTPVVPAVPAVAAPAAQAAEAPAPPAASPAVPLPPAPKAQPVDPVFEAARSSPEARRGLGTRRGLYERILTTRQLLRAWERVGKYVRRPKRKPGRAAEENEFVRQLLRIENLLRQFPPLLGEPGQPGYRVIVLVHDDNPVAMLNGQDVAERGALAMDWLAGQALLEAHRKFLRRELKLLRRRGWAARTARHLRATLDDHPVWVGLSLLVTIVAATAIVLLRI